MSRSLLPPDLMGKLDRLQILARRSFAGRMRGEHRSTRKGASLEFADYRNYVPGDDLRFVDWKVYARLDRLFLKLYLDEEDLFVHVLLDASRSMATGQPAKGLYARRLAAALAYLALSGTHRLAIHPFAAGLAEPIGPARGRGSLARVLAWLERLGADGRTDLARSARAFRDQVLGTGVVFVVSDLLDKGGVDEALRQLRPGRFEVVVLHLLSPEEEEVDWDGDWRLVDAEDDEAVSLSITGAVRREYAATVRRFRGECREACHRLGHVYVPVRTDFPIEDLLLDRLRRRQVLG